MKRRKFAQDEGASAERIRFIQQKGKIAEIIKRAKTKISLFSESRKKQNRVAWPRAQRTDQKAENQEAERATTRSQIDS